MATSTRKSCKQRDFRSPWSLSNPRACLLGTHRSSLHQNGGWASPRSPYYRKWIDSFVWISLPIMNYWEGHHGWQTAWLPEDMVSRYRLWGFGHCWDVLLCGWVAPLCFARCSVHFVRCLTCKGVARFDYFFRCKLFGWLDRDWYFLGRVLAFACDYCIISLKRPWWVHGTISFFHPQYSALTPTTLFHPLCHVTTALFH